MVHNMKKCIGHGIWEVSYNGKQLNAAHGEQ